MDRRHQNNLTKAQRRAGVYGQRRRLKAPKPPAAALEKAKTVLRKRGIDVYDAGIVDPRFVGLIYVDTRKRTPADVIEMAREIEEKEARRNTELRREHGLS